MKDSLFVGMILGIVAGAVLATYNKDVTNAVEKGKQAVKKQVNKASDAKN